HSEPTAPVLGSHAPNTSRSTRAITSAPAHIVHGSRVTASVAPSSRQPSPSTRAASRMARISACAVGSPSASRALTARASSVPSAPTTTAPTGTSRGPAVAATASAARIRSSSATKAIEHRRQLVGEAHLAGNAAQLLVRVEVGLVEDHAEHRLGQAHVGQQPEIALGERVGVFKLVLLDVGIEVVQHFFGNVVLQGRGRVRK